MICLFKAAAAEEEKKKKIEKANMTIQELFLSQLGKENTRGISAFGNWLNGKLTYYEKGKVVKEYKIRHEMTNALGTLHGGVIASILDEIIGMTVISLEFTHLKTTVNLNVDYFYPAMEGQTLIATAQMIKEGKKISHLQGELIEKESGKMIARAITNMFTTDIPVDLSRLEDKG